jgi:hypothetical protein
MAIIFLGNRNRCGRHVGLLPSGVRRLKRHSGSGNEDSGVTRRSLRTARRRLGRTPHVAVAHRFGRRPPPLSWASVASSQRLPPVRRRNCHPVFQLADSQHQSRWEAGAPRPCATPFGSRSTRSASPSWGAGFASPDFAGFALIEQRANACSDRNPGRAMPSIACLFHHILSTGPTKTLSGGVPKVESPTLRWARGEIGELRPTGSPDGGGRA